MLVLYISNMAYAISNVWEDGFMRGKKVKKQQGKKRGVQQAWRNCKEIMAEITGFSSKKAILAISYLILCEIGY